MGSWDPALPGLATPLLCPLLPLPTYLLFTLRMETEPIWDSVGGGVPPRPCLQDPDSLGSKHYLPHPWSCSRPPRLDIDMLELLLMMDMPEGVLRPTYSALHQQTPGRRVWEVQPGQQGSTSSSDLCKISYSQAVHSFTTPGGSG